MEKPVLEINDLTFSYDGKHTLRFPDLHISRGQKTFITGPSGSGKSTLLNLIAGNLTPETGQISINGNIIHALSESKRDQFRVDNIGYIFQMFNLVPYLSILDNICLPLMFSANRRKNITNKHDETKRLLDALEIPASLIDKTVTQLSVGQQQRVAAARALIGKPALIIADEPTSALDSKNSERFLTLLFEQVEQTDSTLLLVSHDERLTNMFDHIVPVISEQPTTSSTEISL